MAEGTALSRDAAAWLAAALDDQALFDFLVSRQNGCDAVFKGFPVNVRSVGKAAVRNRVRSELLHSLEFLNGLLACPGAPWHGWRGALVMFEERWLLSHWRDLIRASRRQDVAVAMVLDPRAAIAARGWRFLRLTRFWVQAPAAGVGARGGEGVRLLAGLLAPPNAAAKGGPDRAGDVAGTERRIRLLEEQLAAARDRLDRDLAKAQAAAARAAEERAGLQAENRDLRTQLHAARRELERQLVQTDERVQAGIQSFQRQALGLSEEVARTRAALAAVAADRLQDRVAQVLEQHRRLNEKHGTLSALRAEAAALQDAEQRLLQCIEESVVVLPELHRLLADVRQRRRSVQALIPDAVLAGGAGADELAGTLLARVKGVHFAGDWSANLDEVEALLGVGLIRDLLGAAGLERLQRAVAERRDVLRRSVAGAYPAEPAPQERGTPRRSTQTPEIWDVAGALERSPAVPVVWLLVDGYNIILGEPHLAAIAEQHGLARAREEMLRLCRRRAAQFRGVEVVFDGTGPVSVRDTVEGVTEVFAAQKQESQNADVYILGRIPAIRPSADTIWLVTSDEGLRRSAATGCAAFVRPTDFYRFLCRQDERPGV